MPHVHQNVWSQNVSCFFGFFFWFFFLEKDAGKRSHIGDMIPYQLNPYLTNGFSHHYHLGPSTIIIRGVRSDL